MDERNTSPSARSVGQPGIKDGQRLRLELMLLQQAHRACALHRPGPQSTKTQRPLMQSFFQGRITQVPPQLEAVRSMV